MKCRKCGSEISDVSIRCPQCGIKVNMKCPNCKTLVLFGENVCDKCGTELLKICPDCGSKNIYSAKVCRKCEYVFTKKEENQPEEAQIIIDNQVEPIEEIEKPIDDEEKVLQEEDPVENDIVHSFSSVETAYTPVSDVVSSDDEEHVTAANVDNQEINENKLFNLDDIPLEDTSDDNNVEVVQSSDIKEAISNIDDVDIDVPILEEYVDDNLLENLENENNIQPNGEESLSLEIQPEAVKNVINVITSSITKQVIALQGPEGCGKTAILKQVGERLSSNDYLFLFGSCTPLVQITSFGFFQDAFLRIMGFPPYTKSIESFIKDFKKSNFYNSFSFLDANELNLFLNIFYPCQKDNFDNIMRNKAKMFDVLEKVIKSFSLNNNLVLAIDNFELLDGASYDFIVHLLEKGYFNNRLKLLVAYQEDKSIQTYFDVSKIDERIFEMIKVNKLSSEELMQAINKSLNIDIQEIMDKNFIDEIFEKANGNAHKIEQELALLFNCKYISLNGNDIIINEDNRPNIESISFEELIKLRLNALQPIVKNVLYMAAIMGYRFAINILLLSVAMPPEKAKTILDFLIQEQFVQQVDNFTCEFKSLTLWKLIYQEAKSDLLYKENSQRLYASLKPLLLSSNLQKLISCTEALSKNEAFLIWQNTASISANLGDTNLYIISQKQCLKIIEEQNMNDAEELKAEIYEQIGKLLCEKSPKEALTYLANVLDSEIKVGNLTKIIDLSGYFVKSCYISGNYFGAVEAVDTVISNIEQADARVSSTDIALIKTRKLKALFNIGNSEQIINLVNEEIISHIESGLAIERADIEYKSLLVDAWLSAKTILAKAYAIQGNNKVFEVISSLKQFLSKYSYNTEYYVAQIALLEAFANTVVGQIKKSNELLNAISLRTKNSQLETDLLCEWNVISIVNKLFSGERDSLKADLFELAAFTNNINEHFMKNIIKLMLGYILKDESKIQKALEIFNEQITYFAKEKVAFGSILSWLLIVQTNIELEDYDKALDIAVRSLEIAQSPKINNYFFIIYFQKYIAEIYLQKGDFTAAKMYLEKAIMLAKHYELKYQLVELYLAYGNYMEEFMKVSNNHTSESVEAITEMYNKSLSLSKELMLNNLIEKVDRAKNDFKIYCQLNAIN